METSEIPNLEDLLNGILGKSKKYEKVEVQRLTGPGENYGSLMVAIKVTIHNDEIQDEQYVHMVAKLVPRNEFIKQFMNAACTFRNEFGFYKTIAPCFRQFQKEQGSNKSLDFFPEFYGGRLNLEAIDNKVDDNTIILLQNLKEEGFATLNRTVGFDLEASKLILTKIAELHGVALALKTVRPELFEENLMPYFEEFRVFQGDEEFVTSPHIVNSVIELVENDELCALHIAKVKQIINNTANKLRLPKNSPDFRQSLFATFVHGDLWVNNIMVKTYQNKVIDIKIVDLQLYEYASVTKDILFFLLTSVQTPVLKEHLDDLINFYYSCLAANLKELKCDPNQYSYNAFKIELKQVATEIEYFRIMGALHVIFASDEFLYDVEEITKENLFKQIQISEACRNRACFITREFIQRGWI